MSFSISQLNGFSPLNLAAGRALHGHRAHGSATVNAPADADTDSPANSSSAATAGANQAAAGVQDALTSVQTSAGHLSVLSGHLTSLGHLATLARNGPNSATDLAQYQQEFSSLQDQVRATIGGPASEIGGTAVDAPAGSFQGAALFGPDTPAGNASFGQVDLRQGALLQLMSQDSAGTYGLNATSPDVSAVIAGAAQQVSDGRSSLQAAQSQLGLAAAQIQVGQQNLQSAVAPISDAGAAQQSAQFARYSMLADLATALKAQANQAPAAVLNVIAD